MLGELFHERSTKNLAETNIALANNEASFKVHHARVNLWLIGLLARVLHPNSRNDWKKRGIIRQVSWVVCLSSVFLRQSTPLVAGEQAVSANGWSEMSLS
jgi:hypothetical protein